MTNKPTAKRFYEQPHTESQQCLKLTNSSMLLVLNSQQRGYRYILTEKVNPRDNLQQDILFLLKFNLHLTAVATART